MKINFYNKKILITGGTRGIGKQIATDMLGAGGKVFITGTKKVEIKGCEFIESNFLDPNSKREFLNKISLLDIDILINNAGINRIDSISDLNLKDLSDIIHVNLITPIEIIQAVISNMKNKRYGRIVNISSVFGNVSKEKRISYSSSKFGLKGATLAIASEVAKFNILVNCVSPGFTLTDLTKQILKDDGIKEIELSIPIGRLAEVQDISKVVLFIASDLNSYISGQDIIVDGGFVNV